MTTDNLDTNSEILRGSINKVTFHNPDTGFTVLDVETSSMPFPIKVVGIRLPINVGSEIIAKGKYTTHEKFGKQFSAESAEEIAPTTTLGLKKFLASGVFDGIGEKTADLIVNKLGMDALNIIINHPDKLMRIQGIGAKKAKRIVNSVKEHQQELEVRRYFSDVDITPVLAQKIIKLYGDDAISIIQANPYQLAFDITGVGFLTADKIAEKIGIDGNDPRRQKAGIYFSLIKAQDDGHCYLTKEQLGKKACYLLGLNSLSSFNEVFQELIDEEKIVIEGENIYVKKTYLAETTVGKIIAERLKARDEPKIEPEDIRKAIQDSERQMNVKLSEEQREAVYLASKMPFMIITGGPGCGKTTVINSIVNAFQRAEKNILLAAPTGKAAQKMSQISGLPASTIHRLLKFDPFMRCFHHGPQNPLVFDEESDEALDLLIIDESSMLDIELAKDLFSSLAAETTLLLVGDKDQLPSVGPGRVFADLLSIEDIPRIILSKLFRRSGESKITLSAHQVNSGVAPDIPEPDGQTKSDAYFIHRKSPEEISNLVDSLVKEQIPKKFNIPSDQITILTPTNKGQIGTVNLNRSIQSKLNPENPSKAYIQFGEDTYRVGDVICQRVNNYTIDPLGVFNGDMGVITEIDAKEKEMHVKLWDNRIIKYESQHISQLSLSYAITIHRSQGSEMPCIVLALHESQFTLLDRQLLYTAITRAKKLLVIVGSKRALEIAARKVSGTKRQTGLKKRIARLRF